MGVIADFFARLLRMCPGRLLTGFLLIRHEVRAIFKTCNQLYQIIRQHALARIIHESQTRSRDSLPNVL
jgi:hypothetical protein